MPTATLTTLLYAVRSEFGRRSCTIPNLLANDASMPSTIHTLDPHRRKSFTESLEEDLLAAPSPEGDAEQRWSKLRQIVHTNAFKAFGKKLRKTQTDSKRTLVSQTPYLKRNVQQCWNTNTGDHPSNTSSSEGSSKQRPENRQTLRRLILAAAP